LVLVNRPLVGPEGQQQESGPSTGTAAEGTAAEEAEREELSQRSG
jgi:hypothetical protein